VCPACSLCARFALQGSFTPAWAENIFVASCLRRYSKRRADGKATPVAERYLKQNEFVEAVVRVSYAKHPDLVRLVPTLLCVWRLGQNLFPIRGNFGRN